MARYSLACAGLVYLRWNAEEFRFDKLFHRFRRIMPPPIAKQGRTTNDDRVQDNPDFSEEDAVGETVHPDRPGGYLDASCQSAPSAGNSTR